MELLRKGATVKYSLPKKKVKISLSHDLSTIGLSFDVDAHGQAPTSDHKNVVRILEKQDVLDSGKVINRRFC